MRVGLGKNVIMSDGAHTMGGIAPVPYVVLPSGHVLEVAMEVTTAAMYHLSAQILGYVEA